MEWSGFALSLHGQPNPETGLYASGYMPIEARDERIRRGLKLLGDPAAVDFPVTVPAGSVLLFHPDLFHRVSRGGRDGLTNHDVAFRPRLGGGFTRGSEPMITLPVRAVGTTHDEVSSDLVETTEFSVDPVSRPVWESNLGFIRGGRTAEWRCGEDQELELVVFTMRTSSSDRERTSAGYQLGWWCQYHRDSEVRTQAVQSLTESLTNGNEAVQRAAMYGLSVGGAPAADAMQKLITELLLPTTAGKPLEMQTPLLRAADGSSYGLYKSRWHVLTSAIFSFGEAVEVASLHAVELMSRVVAVANAEIEEHMAAPNYAENRVTLDRSLFSGSKRPDWDLASASVYDATLETDWFVHLRRRAAAAAITACGHLGHRAVLADEVMTTVEASRTVCRWLVEDEPGANSPKPSPAGYLSDSSLRGAAAPVRYVTSTAPLLLT